MLLLVGSLNQDSCLSVVHAIKFQQTLLCLFLLQEIWYFRGSFGFSPTFPNITCTVIVSFSAHWGQIYHFISRKCCKTYENRVKSPKSILSFTFFKAVQWTGLESLPGRFWPTRLMFDNPVLDLSSHSRKQFGAWKPEHNNKNICNRHTSVSKKRIVL